MAIETFDPHVTFGPTFGADGETPGLGALICVVVPVCIISYACSNGSVVFCFYLVVWDPHVEQFDSLFLAFWGRSSLSKGDLYYGIGGELVNTVNEVGSKFIYPEDFFLDLLL